MKVARLVVVGWIAAAMLLPSAVPTRARVSVPPALTAYHGSLHNHTGYSDGVLDPNAAFTAGRERGLDFMAVTDHSEQIDDAEWLDTLSQAISHTVDGEFVALAGCEYTNNAAGHTNVYNTFRRPVYVDYGYGYADYAPTLADFYDWMHQHPTALGQFNHPTWYGKNFYNWDYQGRADATMQMVEVGCGPGPNPVWSEEEYRNALDHGWRVAPTNNGDTHTDQWGIDNLGRSGIWAAALTADGVLEALRAMRLFATEDGNFEFYLQGDGRWMGETVPNDGAIDFEVYAYDPDGEILASLVLYADQGEIVAATAPDANPFWWTVSLAVDEAPHYYFARGQQPDGERMVTAPLWTWVEHVIINEFAAKSFEWVELYNPTPFMVNVGEWHIVSAYGDLDHTIPAGTKLAPGDYHVVYTGGDRLHDDGDVLSLLTADWEEQDRVGFGVRGGAPLPPIADSCARAVNGYDSGDDARDWNLDDTATMGVANDAPPVALGSAVVLNEVNTTAPPANEAIELFNPLPEGTSLAGWRICDGDSWATIAAGWIPPSEWLVIRPRDYGLVLSALDVAYLFAPDGTRVDQVGWAGAAEEYTWQRICDGEGPHDGYDWASSGGGVAWYDLPPSLGGSNCAPIAGLAAFNDGPTVLGGSTTLSATVSGGAPLWYRWALGDGTVAAGAVVTYSYPAVGVYTAVVTASNVADWAVATTVVRVRPLPVYLPLVTRCNGSACTP
ncbi:MAG: CehA/McbA family metallohydrolase [Anaerolineae bacterium]|nr:CehA/McbA family metallohydrolase [Anaerolineae bacterium]